MKIIAIIKNNEHQIPAPVEAVFDKVFELSVDKLEISRINMIIVNKSINDANTNVHGYGHDRRQSISFGGNRRWR
jgi:hypothetical protein